MYTHKQIEEMLRRYKLKKQDVENMELQGDGANVLRKDLAFLKQSEDDFYFIIRQLLDEREEIKRKIEGMMPTIEEYNTSAQPDRVDGKRQALSEVLALFKEE